MRLGSSEYELLKKQETLDGITELRRSRLSGKALMRQG